MTDVEAAFLDTNVLLAATDRKRSLHAPALRVLSDWPNRNVRLHASGQVLREYLVVATRPPAQNGLGLPLTRALENLDAVLDRMRILEEDVKVAAQLLDLLRAAPVRGKRIHDAGLAATMLAHRVEAIVTSHPSDFRPFADRLRVIDLADC